jgi:ribonuclease P protein component
MAQSFPKSRRLQRRTQFQRVYDQGTKAHGRFMTLFAFPNTLDETRLGVSATRKIGNAVVRNRAKRRVRELFRTLKLPQGLDLVVVVRRELVEAPWQAVVGEFQTLLGRQRRQSGRRRDA